MADAGMLLVREERDKVEREAKEKEWAAQEAERSGEWYYKEVHPPADCPHSMLPQHGNCDSAAILVLRQATSC